MAWDVKGKSAVVTGGNSGIGFEIAAGLAERGAQVTIAVRNLEKGAVAAQRLRERTGADVAVVALDLASLASVRRCAADLVAAHGALHLLVNNAGLTVSRHALTEDGLETTFQVNHLGPFLLTNLLLDRLRASAPARIVNVSSGAHKRSKGLDFDDLQRERRRFRGMAAYSDSKLCNVAFTRELARRLEGTGVTANAFHPGFVRTNFSGDGDTRVLGFFFKIGSVAARSPRKGAETGLYLAASPDVEGVSGEYFFNCRPARISKAAADDDAVRRLWSVSEELARPVPA